MGAAAFGGAAEGPRAPAFPTYGSGCAAQRS